VPATSRGPLAALLAPAASAVPEGYWLDERVLDIAKARRAWPATVDFRKPDAFACVNPGEL
jgi:hypothetical protein